MKNLLPKLISVFLAFSVLIGGVAWGAADYAKSMKRSTTVQSPSPTATKSPAISGNELKLRQDMRELWEEHITWTRAVVVGITDNVPGTDEAKERLLKNPEDMADAFRQYYSDQDAANFESLMRDHLTIAAELVTANKAGDRNRAADIEKRWFDNADQIAELMNKINPSNWPKDSLSAMLDEHLNLLKQEATARMEKRYADDVVTYDQVQNQALMMADAFSDGIIKQFPDRFRNQ